MFEQIVIRRHDEVRHIDPGELAETLLFYRSVHLLLDAGSLEAILKGIGTNNFIRLLKTKRVKATVLTDFMATQTDNPTVGMPVHDFGAISLAAHADGRKYKRKDLVLDAYERLLGDKRLARAKTERLVPHLSFRKQEDEGQPDTGICAQARLDLQDPKYVQFAVEQTLKGMVPNAVLPTGWYFRVVPTNSKSFHIFTDLNFEYLNSLRDSNNAISPAHLVSAVLSARADLTMAAEYMAEMVTDPARSKLIQWQFKQFLHRRNVNADQINAFQDINLSNARAIGEAITAGERSFDEFMKLLDKAERFKSWLAGVNPDEKLLDAYYQEVTRDSWADSLPAKLAKFAVCFGAGALVDDFIGGHGGKAAAAGLELTDNIWADRLLKGWRANQFVNGPLKRFVTG